MKRLLRKIRTLGLPGHGCTPLALVETIAGLVYGEDLPKGIMKSAPEDCAAIGGVISALHDWRREDFSVLGYFYESMIDRGEIEQKTGQRRKSGIFYTPRYITDYLVRAAIDACVRKIRTAPPRILDPACGCGAFLVAGFHELRRRFPDIDPKIIALESLHGVDTDPVAVHIARLTIWLEAGLDMRGLKKLVCNIRHGDALREFVRPGQRNFDVVVGNPPYRNVKRGIDKKTRDFCEKHFVTAHGQWDLAAPFVELALKHLLVPGGACGLILPKPIFLAENYEPVREIVLENDLVAFGPAGAPFESPGVEAGLLVVRAGQGNRKNISILDGTNLSGVIKVGTQPARFPSRLPFRIFSHLADSETLGPILDAVKAGRLVRFGDFIKLTRGIELGKRDSSISKISGSGSAKKIPLIAGESVLPYHASPDHMMKYKNSSDSGKLLKNPALWSRDRMLLIRRVASGPVAAVIEREKYGKVLALNTLYIAESISGSGNQGLFDEYALCALINSENFREIFRQMFAFDDEMFPYLRISQLNQMPMPINALADSYLSKWSRELHEIAEESVGAIENRKSKSLQGSIDARCRKLYSAHVTGG